MSAPVDSLSIKIDASARGANKQLDTLVQKMMQLRSSVNGIKVGNLNTVAAGIQNFSKAAAGLNQVKTSDFTRMAKAIEKISNINQGDLNRAAGAIRNISKAFSNIGNVSDGAEKIAQLAQGISRLGYKSTTQAIQNIPLLTNELKNMMSELSKAPTVSNNLIAMTNAMANLGAQASGIRSLGSAMNGAGRSGNGFFGVMKSVSSGIGSFSDRVRLSNTRGRSFASTLGLLCAKFWALKRSASEIGKAIESSMNYIEEFNYFDVVTEKIGKEWSEDYKKYGYENAEAYSKSFSGRMREDIGKLTGYSISEDGNATYDVDKNLGLDLTKMTNYSAGIMNVTNSLGMTGEASIVTSKAMSKLAGDMSSFKNVDLSTVMNNFQSGLIGQSRALYKYGIDITNATLQQYAYNNGIKKSVTEMTQAEKMQLRMIAILDQSKSSWGDLAKTIQSPSNQFRLFKTNVAAAGRTLGNIFLPIVAKVLPYVNGLAIAVNKLLGYIFKITGMEEEYKKIMGDSGSGYSDAFEGLEEDADTADNAISGIGDSADKSADKVKKLAKQLMGFDELNVITTNESSKSGSTDKNESGAGGTIDLTDQLSAALADYEKVWNDAYKNMTNDAESFADKLTTLFKGAWTTGDGSDIGSAIAGWLNNGIKYVNNNWDVVDGVFDNIESIITSAINGFTYEFNWAGLGTALSNTLQTYLNTKKNFFKDIDWIKLGEGLATSLNSFIGDGENGPIQSYFEGLGEKVRAAIEFALGAIEEFDFENLGEAVKTGINNFFDTMGKEGENGKTGWEELGEALTDGISGIADAIAIAVSGTDWEKIGEGIKELISSINMEEIGWSLGNMGSSFANAFYKLVKNKETWKELGNKIADGINGFLKGMDKVDKKTGLNGWEALGKGITSSIGGIATTITTALKKVKWKKIGQSIAKFIKNIGWGELAWDFVDMAKAAFGAIVDTISGFAETAPLETAIIGIFATLKYTGLGKKVFSSLGKKVITKIAEAVGAEAVTSSAIATAICGAIGTAFKAVPTLLVSDVSLLGAATAAEIGATIFTAVTGGIVAAFGGFSLGEFIGKQLLSDEDAQIVDEYDINVWDFVKLTFGGDSKGVSSEEWKQSMADWWVNDVEPWWGEQKDKVLNIGMSIAEDAKDLWRDIKSLWFGAGDKIANLKADVKASIASGTQKVLDWWDGVKEKSKELVVKAKGKMDSAFDKVKSAWSNFKTGTKEVWAKAKGEVNKKFEDIKEAWSNFKSGTKELYAKAKGKIEETFESVKSTWENIKSETKDILVNAKGKVDETFQNVKAVWSDTKDGVKNLVLKAKGEIKDSVDKIIGKWEDVKDKTVEMIASASKGELFKSIFESSSSAWNAIRSKTVVLSAKAREKGTSIFNRIKRKWKEISTKTATLTATFKDFFTAPLKRAWNAIANAINKAIKIINKIPGVEISNSLPLLAKGGIYSGGSWHNIAKYADGGLPSMGQMFVAREAGPELVGTIGGHTAVMNNNQIVASVSDGVFNALNPVLTYLCNSINTMSAKMDNIGAGGVSVEKYTEGDLLKVIRKEDNNYRKRTGKSAFAL